jgi:beta-lactamase regulating signal transducer with metallopeptidase domain
VLAHEGSHVRQRDFYLQLLAGFYTAITWFSPLGWWLKHKLSELSEAISDRAGLEESAAAPLTPSSYSNSRHCRAQLSQE